MTQLAIQLNNLGKRYRIGIPEPEATTFGGSVVRAVKSPFDYLVQSLRPATEQEILWALRDISFEVEYGQVVGIIGQNGAGKSTLLKILTRLTDPTEGRAILRGRVGSLLEVGTGFHPDLTGRENIYMSGTILGMKKREIDRKLEEIVAFSGVERFLDTPVRRYSSGMNVRLGFAVAAHLEPEILIVDEVLAVGDQAFQIKCLAKMERVSREGRTILIVSHNMAVMSNLCHRIIQLSHGRLVAEGVPAQIISQYVRETTPQIEGETRVPDDRDRGYFLIRPDKEFSFVLGEPITLEYEIECPEPFENACSGLVIYDNLGNPIVGASSTRQRVSGTGTSKRWRIECDLGELPLVSERYFVSVWFGNLNDDHARFPRVLALNIAPADPFGVGLSVPKSWGQLYWKGDWILTPSN